MIWQETEFDAAEAEQRVLNRVNVAFGHEDEFAEVLASALSDEQLHDVNLDNLRYAVAEWLICNASSDDVAKWAEHERNKWI